MILFCPDAWALPPVIAPKGLLTGLFQVYVVPAGIIFPLPFAGDTVNDVPEQIAGGDISATKGFGFTVTVMVNIGPGQEPESGVTV